MAEHIATKMVESMETLTEQNLEAQIKAANELVSDLGGTVIWTPQNTIVSIDQNGNVTYVYPQTATEVIIEATVSYDREIDSTAYRTFTVTIYPLKSATDENTKVTVENMTNGSQLTVSEVTDTSNIVVENGEKEVLVAYDINVTENGEKVEGNYIVKFPAPENTNVPYYIYHIVEGQEPALVATVEELTDGYIVFKTTHFSVYAIVVDKEVEGDEPTQETTESLKISGTTGTLASDSSSISWEGTNIKFVTEKSSSTTAIRTSDDDHFRAYKGSKSIISCLDGSVITKVVITTTGGDYIPAVNSFENGTAIIEGTTVTIVANGNAKEIIINGLAQWRLSEIEVTYGGQSGSTPEQPTHEHTACPECGNCTATDCDGAETEKCLGHEEQPSYNHILCVVCGKCTTINCECPEGKCECSNESGGQWTLVTNVSQLQTGDKIVIVAKDSNYALSTVQNNNNRGQAAVAKSGTNITFGDDVQILTLEEGTKSGTFAFNTGSGYLYAANSGSNHLKTQVTNNDNGSWEITIAADGTATIVAQGSNTRNTMQYNQSSSLFACYGSASQKAVCIYKCSTN